MDEGIEGAAKSFRVLGNASRLEILWILTRAPLSVSELVEATGLSQPLVSQHLRTLRDAGLVTSVRNGRVVTNQVADLHVAHVVGDAIAHAREDHAHPYIDSDHAGNPDHDKEHTS